LPLHSIKIFTLTMYKKSQTHKQIISFLNKRLNYEKRNIKIGSANGQNAVLLYPLSNVHNACRLVCSIAVAAAYGHIWYKQWHWTNLDIR